MNCQSRLDPGARIQSAGIVTRGSSRRFPPASNTRTLTWESSETLLATVSDAASIKAQTLTTATIKASAIEQWAVDVDTDVQGESLDIDIESMTTTEVKSLLKWMLKTHIDMQKALQQAKTQMRVICNSRKNRGSYAWHERDFHPSYDVGISPHRQAPELLRPIFDSYVNPIEKAVEEVLYEFTMIISRRPMSRDVAYPHQACTYVLNTGEEVSSRLKQEIPTDRLAPTI